jgi:hypothetical protein
MLLQPIPSQTIIDIKDSVVYYGNKLKQAYKDKYAAKSSCFHFKFD